MTDLALTVNGKSTSHQVQPRLTLADFLRELHMLTSVHLGCEQGACGACTVNLDGQPVRSCTIFASTCAGRNVKTLEAFESDVLMNALRSAFSEEHALQCGFCTPGMLMTAYDIVSRLREPDEKRIRLELSGNLCRCTGYIGLVKAVARVIAERQAGSHNSDREPI